MVKTEVFDKPCEIQDRSEKLNTLLELVTRHYFRFDKADINSKHEKERSNAYILCAPTNPPNA